MLVASIYCSGKKRLVVRTTNPNLSVTERLTLCTQCAYQAARAIGVNESSFAFTVFALIKSVASLVAVDLLLVPSKPFLPRREHIV